MLLRIKATAVIGVAVAGGALWRLHRGRASWQLVTPRERALAAVAGAGLLGGAWFVIVAGMTQAGFSGNDRYLVLGAALIDIAGAIALGWAAAAVGRGLARRGVNWTRATAAGVVLMAGVYVGVPNFVGKNLISVSGTYNIDTYQAQLREDAARTVASLGGPDKVLSCGTIMTDSFQVPMVAYDLGVRILRIETSPEAGFPPGQAPNVIFAAHSDRSAPLSPQPSTWPQTHYRLIAQTRTFSAYAACAGGGGA
jgi:hypothetical protein